ncbi:CocE/NonD family hydrolase [Pseudomonadales bacterium]|nr:CocE/NonD family hydrolase [Pseudomonadales bacterium]MDB4542362.1 CocE/NonD family hydrolase [Pseudomonadales bacterium]
MKKQSIIRAVFISVLLGGLPAATWAFSGPFASLVTVEPGVQIDVDVRVPATGTPPATGWPVIFFAHGSGGDKTSFSQLAGEYADDGYVTLSYTNRPEEDRSPQIFASDIVALKAWLLNAFEAELGVTAPTDSNKFGMAGNSLGGYTTWSGILLSNAFAAAVPYNFAYHHYVDYLESQGSIARAKGQLVIPLVGGEYPAAAVDAAVEAVFNPIIANFPNVTIPVQNHVAMLDSLWLGTHALTDYLQLTSASGRMIYIGTGGHGTARNDEEYRGELRSDWFDHYLKGVANGIDTTDAIQISLLGTNEKVSYPSWPPAGQVSSTLYLGEGGRLNTLTPSASSAFDSYINDPGSLTWANLPNFNANTFRSQMNRDVLTYETLALQEDALIVGEPSATLYVEGTASRYQVNVHLFDVSPAGEPILLAVGTATTDASPAELTIPLSVTGRRVPAGHSIRLEITNRDDQDIDPTNGHTPELDELRYMPFVEYSENRVFFDTARPSSIAIPLINASGFSFSSYQVPTLGGMGFFALMLSMLSIGAARLRKK